MSTAPARPAAARAGDRTTAPAPQAADGADATGYGGFRLGGLDLALPMAALREVLPLGALTPLPCPAACVLGGMALRGVLVPVVDLALALGGPASVPGAFPCVVVMVHGGRILGLLADGVTGVFAGSEAGLNRAVAGGGGAALLAGSLLREDDQTLVSVLSPAALATLPQVPMVEDPEPARQQRQPPAPQAGPADRDDLEAAPIDDAVPMMLVRCGRLPLAIDAMAVHATLSLPQVQPSVLAMGHCRGVIDYAGARIPAVDLLALCGLGRTDIDDAAQAFVMHFDTGFVAFLVAEVVDVVRTRPADLIALPAVTLQRAALFAGVLPVTALAAEVVARAGTAHNPYLVLCPRALRAEPDLAGLSATNTPGDAVTGFAQAAADAQGRRSMITYGLGGETATPIDQISEILAYQPDLSVLAHDGPMLGLVVDRGRAIPVMCLSRLAGAAPTAPCAAVSVLVVHSDGGWMGFAVPHLQTIDAADWQDPAADSAEGGDALPRAAAGPFSGPLDTRRLARVGSGAAERLLPVLDLQGLARSLQAQAA